MAIFGNEKLLGKKVDYVTITIGGTNYVKRKRSEVCAAADHNDWIHAFTGYSDELELTKAIAHALIGKIEVYSTNRIKVFLLYRDEYKALSHAPGLECKQVTA